MQTKTSSRFHVLKKLENIDVGPRQCCLCELIDSCSQVHEDEELTKRIWLDEMCEVFKSWELSKSHKQKLFASDLGDPSRLVFNCEKYQHTSEDL